MVEERQKSIWPEVLIKHMRTLKEGENNMKVFERRGSWRVTDNQGINHRFETEEQAKDFAGWTPPVEETLNGSKEKEAQSSKKEANTNQQKTVLNSKSSYKKKI